MTRREHAIRVIALRDVVDGTDPAYQIRSQLRWYARTFHTPLHVVERDVPLDVVQRTYYEEIYETMRDGDARQQELLAEERRRMSLRLDDLREAQRAEDTADAQAEAMFRRQRARERARDAPPVPVPIPPDVELRFDVGPEDQALGPIFDRSP